MKTELERRFEIESKRFPEIRQEFMGRVARWVYSRAEIGSWDDPRRKSRDADILPGPDGALSASGFDASDKQIVFHGYEGDYRYGDTIKGPAGHEIWLEEFIQHDGQNREVMRFNRGKLEQISKLTFQGHLLIENESVVHGCYQHSLMQYEGRKMKLQQSLDANGRVFFEIVFGKFGQHSYFRVKRDGSRRQLYQPLPKGVSVKSLKDTVRNRLVELIPPLVAAMEIRGPIYCVALVYDDEGNDPLPPMVGVGLDSERQRWKSEHGKRAKDLVWNPAEFHHYEKSHTQLSDDAFEEASDFLNSKWAETDSAKPATKLLEEAAAALHRAPWPDSILRTKDFVVFAVGLEGSGLKRSLKACLTPEELADLKSAGWL